MGRGLREIQTLLWVLRGRDVCRETLADFTERKAHVDLKERAGLQCMEVGKGGCSRPTFFGSKGKTQLRLLHEKSSPTGSTWTKLKMGDLVTETILGTCPFLNKFLPLQIFCFPL